MKRLILLRGVSGSGKSSFASLLSCFGCTWHESVHMFSADDYFTNELDEYNFDQTKIKEAHADCLNRTRHHLSYGDAVAIVHNTFAAEWQLEPYYELAKELDAEVYCLVVENRHQGISIHNVPEEVLERQATQLSESIKLR